MHYFAIILNKYIFVNSEGLILMSDQMVTVLRRVLLRGEARTQEDLRLALAEQGFDVNQSKISRLLKKLGAAKTRNTEGEIIYRLPREPAPPGPQTRLSELIIDIVDNGMLIVIYTSPGSASMVARLLDYLPVDSGVMATVAGDDTILVVPSVPSLIGEVRTKIRQELLG